MKHYALLLTLFLWLPLAASVGAQGGQFESETAVTFGQRIVFTLTAVTDEPLTVVALTFQPTGSPPKTETVTPVQLADGRWQAQVVLAPQSAGLSPYAAITYEWLVTLGDNETVAVPAQTVTYQDDRFAWKKIEQPAAGTAVTIFWPGESDKPGRVAFALVQQAAARLQTILPLSPHTPLPIFLYPSTADLRSALRLNGHDWTGQTDPALGVVLATAVNEKTAAADLRRSLPGEISRFWLYQAAGPQYADIPYWFKEGLAVWLADGPAYQATADPVPLADLCQVEPPDTGGVAAVQSGALVQFVAERYGRQALAALAMAFAQGMDCDTAVPIALGVSVTELERHWATITQPQPTAVRFVQQHGVWLLLLLAGFILMGLLVMWPRGGGIEMERWGD
ncbi:MAG: hypothetical protein HS099_03870 [Ardenticatenaceae bacterium]|nr:hypothetical protein [Ardenticatenaceae bacterium]